MTLSGPTTIRLHRGDRAALDALARRLGTTRSELLRRLVAGAVRREPESVAKVAGHEVRYALPAVPDDAPVSMKEAVALRNDTALAGRCQECGAVGEVVDEPPRLVAPRPRRVVASRSGPVPRGLEVPPGTRSVATTRQRDGTVNQQAVVFVQFKHQPHCPAR